jgi:hypothetical protein
MADTRTKVIMLVLPKERNGLGTPVSGSRLVVPAKITIHCATTSTASPAAVTTRSGVRLSAAMTSPCPATATRQTR